MHVCAWRRVSSTTQWAMSFSPRWTGELVRVSLTFTAQRLVRVPCCTCSLWLSELQSSRKVQKIRGWKSNAALGVCVLVKKIMNTEHGIRHEKVGHKSNLTWSKFSHFNEMWTFCLTLLQMLLQATRKTWNKTLNAHIFAFITHKIWCKGSLILTSGEEILFLASLSAWLHRRWRLYSHFLQILLNEFVDLCDSRWLF